MRGSKAKRLRRIADSVLIAEGVIDGAAPHNERKVRVGRRYGGPAFGKFEYPESFSVQEWGDFQVLTINPDTLRQAAVDAGVIDADNR